MNVCVSRWHTSTLSFSCMLLIVAFSVVSPLSIQSLNNDSLFFKLLEAIRTEQSVLSVPGYHYWPDSLDGTQLRILRNAVYARHGYIFRSKDLDMFFCRYEWYIPKNGIAIVLTEIDKENLQMIQSWEAEDALLVQVASVHADIPNKYRVYVGVWQDSPLVAAGYGHTYSFFPNGAVIEGTNEMDGLRRLVNQVGTWVVDNGHISIVYTHRTYRYGGELVDASGSLATKKALVKTTTKFEEYPDTRYLVIGPIITTEEFGMKIDSCEINVVRWYRIMSNPKIF